MVGKSLRAVATVAGGLVRPLRPLCRSTAGRPSGPAQRGRRRAIHRSATRRPPEFVVEPEKVGLALGIAGEEVSVSEVADVDVPQAGLDVQPRDEAIVGPGQPIDRAGRFDEPHGRLRNGAGEALVGSGMVLRVDAGVGRHLGAPVMALVVLQEDADRAEHCLAVRMADRCVRSWVHQLSRVDDPLFEEPSIKAIEIARRPAPGEGCREVAEGQKVFAEAVHGRGVRDEALPGPIASPGPGVWAARSTGSRSSGTFRGAPSRRRSQTDLGNSLSQPTPSTTSSNAVAHEPQHPHGAQSPASRVLVPPGLPGVPRHLGQRFEIRPAEDAEELGDQGDREAGGVAVVGRLQQVLELQAKCLGQDAEVVPVATAVRERPEELVDVRSHVAGPANEVGSAERLARTNVEPAIGYRTWMRGAAERFGGGRARPDVGRRPLWQPPPGILVLTAEGTPTTLTAARHKALLRCLAPSELGRLSGRPRLFGRTGRLARSPPTVPVADAQAGGLLAADTPGDQAVGNGQDAVELRAIEDLLAELLSKQRRRERPARPRTDQA